MKRDLYKLVEIFGALLLIIGGFATVFEPALVYAAWPATENFDSYTNGAGLNALNGGSGWGGAWTSDSGDCTVTNAQFVTSPNSGTCAGGNGDFRNVTSNTDGDTQYISIRSDSVGAGVHAFYQPTDTNTGNELFQLRFNAGNIDVKTPLLTTTLQAYSANQWYNIKIVYNYSGLTATFTIDNGAPSSALSFRVGALSITRIFIYDMASGNSWFDAIAPTPPPSNTPAFAFWSAFLI